MTYVNEELVPVWINVRTTPVPDVPALVPVLDGIELSDHRMVAEKHRGFFLRSAVTSPDGTNLLNPEPTDAPVSMLFEQGHFPYARVEAKDYLPMLRAAVALYRQSS